MRRLFYRQPAKNWNEALPIGNGRLGGMVFGTVPQAHIQLNEESMWCGGFRDRNNPDARENLSRVRKLIKDGAIGEGEELLRYVFSGVPQSQRPYQSLGDFHYYTGIKAETIKNYEHMLDFEHACSIVSRMMFSCFCKRTATSYESSA